MLIMAFFLGTGALGPTYWDRDSRASFSVNVSMYIRGPARVPVHDLPVVRFHRAVWWLLGSGGSLCF